ncbi:MAG: glycerol-3-phosphate 1-O-acyltransferase PlsY [Planctomycetota bacterium]|nr:glycerol-3-phosphate 1-O-acyltransferase PlsY [Planctomycetota bacterium]
MVWIACILSAYIVGSIPFGVILGRLKGIDILQHGSRNPGATNVMRVLGKPFGYACFVLDVSKGAIPTIMAGFLNEVINRPPHELTQGQMLLWLAVPVAAVLGHMFSIFLGFKGGKGVATGFGSLAAMWPLLTIPTFCAVVVWYFLLRTTKYVAVASIGAAFGIPLAYLLSVVPNDLENMVPTVLHASPPFWVTGIIACLVLYQHRTNLGRIRRGEEPQAGGAARRGKILSEKKTETE